jgi:arabinose-5-phosphate isomerase
MLNRAKEVLEIEAEAIKQVRERLDDRFVDAANLILDCKGRTVVTGMGKSGAVARKIAGTLASTGTPSLYLHPAEGVHGDLGMVTKNDVVLALSNSGETEELLSILSVIKRIGAKLISMVGRSDSTLAQASDVILDVAVEREACPLGLAPTASTTVAIAMGDALALAVMEARKFTTEDYALFHPAGALGRRLTFTVADVMRTHERMAVVNEDDLVRDVLFSITNAGAGAALVVNDAGVMTGIITDGDIRRNLLSDSNCLNKIAKDIMSRNPKKISPEQLASAGLHILEVNGIGELAVIDKDNKPIGVLMLKDLFKAGIA